MILSNRRSIEDVLVEVLALHPYTPGSDLVSALQSIRPRTTKQAVYAALRYLVANEVVSKVEGRFFLSRVWISKVKRLLSHNRYRENFDDGIFQLQNGDAISYHFPNLLACDHYWAHIFDVFTEWLPPQHAVFVWNPHQWIVIAREDVERPILQGFANRSQHAFFTIYGDTPLDRTFREQWQTEYISVCTGSEVVFPSNKFINVFQDFVLEVVIRKEVAQEIEHFYETHRKLTRDGRAALIELIERRHPVRMKISRDRKKASAIRKKLAKEFVVPKGLVVD
jgi:hypothetical protein